MKGRPGAVVALALIAVLAMSSSAWAGAKKQRGYRGSGVSPWMGNYRLDSAKVDGTAWDAGQVLTTGTTYSVEMSFSWVRGGTDPTTDPNNPFQQNSYVQNHSVSLLINSLGVWAGTLSYPMTLDDYNRTGFWDLPQEFHGTVTADLSYQGTIDPTGLWEATLTRSGTGGSDPDEWVLPVTMENPGAGPGPVPEPATLVLFSTGVLGMIAASRRRKGRPARRTRPGA